MAEPLACPHCRALLTDAEVVRLHRQYAAAQRKTKAGGHNGGRPPRYPDRSQPSARGSMVSATIPRDPKQPPYIEYDPLQQTRRTLVPIDET